METWEMFIKHFSRTICYIRTLKGKRWHFHCDPECINYSYQFVVRGKKKKKALSHDTTKNTATWKVDVGRRLAIKGLFASTWPEEKMRAFVIWIFVSCYFLGFGATAQGQSTPSICSPSCHCDKDGLVDCSGKGLIAIPVGLSAFTYHL